MTFQRPDVDSGFPGGPVAHMVEWRGERYPVVDPHRLLRAARRQRLVTTTPDAARRA